MSEHLPVSKPIDLKGQAAIVTGAARGIGRGIALALAREGADVTVADVLPTDEAVAEIGAYKRRALGISCDVTHSADIATVIERTLEEFGRIDVLVNNAGVAGRGGLEDTTEDLWYRDIDVIMTGAYRMTQAVFPVMKRQGYGKIVNISSVSGKIGGAISKPTDSDEALLGRTGPAFTKWVAKAGGHYGIYCNAVCPGPVETEMTRGFDYSVEGLPIARMGQPEDIAEAVVFLASPAAHYITGQALNVDGGMVMD